jgi:transposase-like protein
MNKINLDLSNFYSEISSKNIHQTITKTIEDLALKNSFINGRECPYCSSHRILGKGKYRGRKRYICKDCGKSYNDLTGTPFEGIRDLEKMYKYIACMVNGYSIRKAATMVGISIVTSFNWRHRLLDKFKLLPSVRMKNVLELREKTIPFSAKGQRKPVPKKLLEAKVSVIFSCDRVGKVDSDSVFTKDFTKNKLFKRLEGKLTNHSEVISDNRGIMKSLSGIMKQVTNSNNDLYSHNQLARAVVLIWEEWMVRFKGVATKYLNNYLHWFDYLENSIHKSQKELTMVRLLLRR